MASEGRGFVHLNTPASIEYTAAQKVSLTAVSAQKSRVETVQLPAWMRLWRRAQQQFVQRHGYSAYPVDKEDVRDGNGPVYPPLAPNTAAHHPSFFVSTPPFSIGGDLSSGGSGAETSGQGETIIQSRMKNGANGAASDSEHRAGLTIVSHHKVSGACQFTYPDYDGVLSGGVVPEVVPTSEEIQAEEAKRALYVTPLELTDEEAGALEELQALWKSRSLSHSFDGSQHRAAEGTIGRHMRGHHRDVSDEENNPRKKQRQESVPQARDHQGIAVTEEAEAEEDRIPEDTTMQDFEEALRMADELLRFA